MIIGTAGHVDHGKTALVRALTGIDADRLAEEKRRGITIDLGYAYTDEFGFVDVPGHERFVHTMLAGASGIDAALLVVALPEGVMPQTREHAQILDLLGIDRGVVALTKADLAPDRIAAVTSQVRDLLAGTGLANAAIIPVSAVTGIGIDALSDALRCLSARKRDVSGYPRLAIDRAFTLSGAGLVVTGALVAGRIAVEDRLVLSPSGIELRVRGLHANNQPARAADSGQRVALNITGLRLSKDTVNRGDWIVHPAIHAPTRQLDVRIRLLPTEARALRSDAPVHLHLGAAHLTARVSLLDTDRLEPGATGLARLTLAHPIGALAMDRVVLRDAGAERTIGGGIVLDPFPPHRGRRSPARLAQLASLDTPRAEDALRALLALPPGWVDKAQLFRSRNVKGDTLVPAAGALSVGPLAITRPAFDALRAELLRALETHHAASPDQPGLQPERLRLLLSDRPPSASFAAIIEALLRNGSISQDGPWLRLPTHRITLSPRDEQLWEEVRRLIAAERFRPPRTRDLAAGLSVPEAAMRATLKRLQRMGRVVEIAQDHFFLRETVAEMAGIAAQAIDGQGLVTAAALRDRLDNGRKVAIQVLEFFDRVGVTIRVGDVRRVRSDRLGLFGDPPDASVQRI